MKLLEQTEITVARAKEQKAGPQHVEVFEGERRLFVAHARF